LSELRVASHGDVVLWTLDRPARKNALSLSLLAELDEARARAAASSASVVVLTGSREAGVFCAGFDRNDLARLAAEGATTAEAASPLHGLFERMESAPFSLVTAIDGAAIGGGCELALLGDVRVASARSTFALPPARLGIVYPPDGLARLQAALGASLLGAMLATAAPVDAGRLHAVGALFALDEDPVAAALRLAEGMATLVRDARLGNRDALRRVARHGRRGGPASEE